MAGFQSGDLWVPVSLSVEGRGKIYLKVPFQRRGTWSHFVFSQLFLSCSLQLHTVTLLFIKGLGLISSEHLGSV